MDRAECAFEDWAAGEEFDEVLAALVLEDVRDAALLEVRASYLLATTVDRAPVTVAERCWDELVLAYARTARVAIQAIPERSATERGAR